MDTRNALWILGGIVLLVAVLWGLWFFLGGTGSGNNATSTSTSTQSGAQNPAATSSVMLAVLDLEGNSNGKSRGCDKVIMVPWKIATTTMPLTGALQALFALNTTTLGSWFNFIDRTNETLKFDRATVVDGTANVYLTGSLTGLSGVCDDPRAASQIEETALQFSTVQRVQLYLNNATTTLIPSER
ncbi:MAG: GerMN domain-containing protein [Candidatus Kaiserbacteria bacterium]|nr:MAG: GerMN domain-containing protein [Candidatus Kaiserbacteria bacterium]